VSDIYVLRADEIDQVSGGPGPLVALVLNPAVATAIVGGVAAVATAAIAAVNALSKDDCTTTTTKQGNKTVTTTVCT
jgi:hypothetical protein